MGAGLDGIIFDDLETRVRGYLKVEYLADGARVFNCTKHVVDH